MTLDLDAEHYRQHSSFQMGVVQPLLDQISLDGDEIILDVGCGDGRISAALSTHVPKGKVIGIDPSTAMIALATASFPNSDFPNLHFQKSPAEEIDINEQADLALIFNALHWVRDPHKAFQCLDTALKPGSTLYILTYPQESLYWTFLEKVLEAHDLQPFKPQAALHTVLYSHEYATLLTDLGFSIDSSQVEEELATYATPQDLSDTIKGWLHCFVPLPPALEARFLDEAKKLASAEYLDSTTQEIHIPYSKLCLTATK